MPLAKEHVLEFGGRLVRVLDWDGKPPVLVGWPGMGGTAEYFGMLRDIVPYRVIGIDPPGVGPISSGVPDRETLAAVWPGVLHWASLGGGPVVAVGHSWGGYLARLVLRHPELGVAGVILLDGGYMPWTTPGVSLEAEMAEGLRFMAQQRTDDRDAAVQRGLELLRQRGTAITTAARAALQSGFIADGAGGYRMAMRESAFRAAMTTMATIDPDQYLDAVGPCLLFASSAVPDMADDAASGGGEMDLRVLRELWPASLARFRSCPGSTVVELADTSHEVLPEASDRVAAEITRWLSTLLP